MVSFIGIFKMCYFFSILGFYFFKFTDKNIIWSFTSLAKTRPFFYFALMDFLVFFSSLEVLVFYAFLVHAPVSILPSNAAMDIQCVLSASHGSKLYP